MHARLAKAIRFFACGPFAALNSIGEMYNVAAHTAPLPGAWSYFWASCWTIWIGLFAFFFGRVLPAFNNLFKGFGADLPDLTKLVVAKALLVWLLLVGMCLVQFGLYIYLLVSRTHIARRAIAVSSGLNVALHLLLIGAVYAPIFKLGAVV